MASSSLDNVVQDAIAEASKALASTEAVVNANLRGVKSSIAISSSQVGTGKYFNGNAAAELIENYNGLSIKINALQEAMKRVLEQDNLNLIAADMSVRSLDSLLVYYMAAMKNMLLLSSAIHYFRRCRFFEDQACRQYECDCICDCVEQDCRGYCYTCGSYCHDCNDCDCDSCGDCDCDTDCDCVCDCFGGCSDCVECDCYCDGCDHCSDTCTDCDIGCDW